MKRKAHEAGLFARVARKKPYIKKINRAKRLNYARIYRKKFLDFWNRVLLGQMKPNLTYWGQMKPNLTYWGQMER